MLACCIYACQDRHKSTADIICGGSYRYWYEQDSPNYYHYFDVNGRKESFCLTRKGIFKEVKMPDFEKVSLHFSILSLGANELNGS